MHTLYENNLDGSLIFLIVKCIFQMDIFLLIYTVKRCRGDQVKRSYQFSVFILCSLSSLAVCALPTCLIQFCETRMPHLNCR